MIQLIVILIIVLVAVNISLRPKTKEVRIGIVSMIKNPKNLETWLDIHRKMGINRFYIRLEDSPGWEDFLHSQQDVHLIIGGSSGINEYEEIQVRQTYMVDNCLKIASKDGIDWLIHIDSDELLEGDLSEIRNLPNGIRTIKMKNVEAKYEKVPGKSDNCFSATKFLDCGSEPCVSYANGKGGGRTTMDVSSFGPHRFKSLMPNSEQAIKIYVKHFESCDFEMYKNKYMRLAHTDRNVDIPFPYYHESIEAAKQGDEQLELVFKKYRVA